MIKLGIPCSECKDESLFPCTREDEAIAIAVGMSLCGVEDINIFMQNSGFGVSVDVITSLLKPYDIKLNFQIYRGSETPQHDFMNKKYLHIIRLLK